MKKIVITISLFIFATSFATKIFADSAINNGINYLGTQLNGATGQIKGGSTGDASPWATIAFSANGIDPSTVKSSTGAPSLLDYLQNNPPTTSSPATDWEKWILAIVASGKDPYNFGGNNYVATLESSTYYNNNQIGDITTENDDWFGVLALIASGVSPSSSELTDSVSFIISHQNSDGGFGYSTDPSIGSDGNDTAAAIQALVAAQEYGVNNPGLCSAIANAKTYILGTYDTVTGGFLYDTNPWTTGPDTDSTTWAIMTLNVLGMQSSQEATHAKTWLMSPPQQSSSDGGFTACNQWDPMTYACTGFGSNSTTTSHALIGLAGKGWILKSLGSMTCNNSEAISIPSPTVIPTFVPTATPTSVPASSNTSSSPTATPTPIPTTVPATPTPIHTVTRIGSNVLADATVTNTSTPTPASQSVLGSTTQNTQVTKVAGAKNYTFPITFGIVGLLFLLAGIGRLGYKYFWGN